MKKLLPSLIDLIIVFASAALVAGLVSRFSTDSLLPVIAFFLSLLLWGLALRYWRRAQKANLPNEQREAHMDMPILTEEVVIEESPARLKEADPELLTAHGGLYLASPCSAWSDSDGDHHSHTHHFYLLLNEDGQAYSSPMSQPVPGDGDECYITGTWSAWKAEGSEEVRVELLLKRNAPERHEPIFEIDNEDRRNMKYGGSLIDADDYFNSGYYAGLVNDDGHLRFGEFLYEKQG